MQERSGVFKPYLMAALESKEMNLSYLDIVLGTLVPSMDIRNCELLVDAGLFREEVKVTIDGRNRYKIFYLTSLGTELARQIREESVTEQIPQSPQIMPP